MIDPQSLTKRYYKIGEVAKMFGVATSLIRYWESEFDILEPLKNAKGVRRYQNKDVLIVDRIYELVKVRGYKLDGAKKALRERKELPPTNDQHIPKNPSIDIQSIKQELLSIREGLLRLKSELTQDKE